jgi:hypothetical protein
MRLHMLRVRMIANRHARLQWRPAMRGVATTAEAVQDRSMYFLDPINLKEGKFEKILIANRGKKRLFFKKTSDQRARLLVPL